MDSARQLSDIRSRNAPAFRLKASFSFIGSDLETVKGTYTEVWISSSQWRRETVVNNLRRIDIGGPTRHWLLDSGNDFPEPAARVSDLMDLLPPSSANLEFESVVERAEHEPVAQCAITKRDSAHPARAFCFEKKSGILLERISREGRPRNVVDYACSYGGFEKFGNYWFPREMVCFEDRHRKVEAKVTALETEPSPDLALFAPPPEAIELGRCPVDPLPPRAVSTSIGFPFGIQHEIPRVMVWLVVDAKGKPQNAKVVRPGDKKLDETALRAVRDWKFRPATCNGEPMSMAINVEVSSSLLR
jgi:TonB family protein